MYKIFIDTNIYLDFYRANNKDNIIDIINDIEKYKDFLICTEQSDDEFFRNRERIINEFIEVLSRQKNSFYDNNFISTLESYDKYSKSIKAANESIKEMMEKCMQLIKEIDRDPIYTLYSKIRTNMCPRNEAIIDMAIKRKYIGNPPTSNKTTCCDEIIWETLLYYSKNDLIVVSRDGTYKENYNFLANEFKRKTNHQLIIVESISEAVRLNGEIPSETLEDFENNLIVEKEFLEYGTLKEKGNWVNIIYNALLNLGGEAPLKEIYEAADSVISEKYPEKKTNKNMKATIRGMLQKYSSDTENFNKKVDLFRQISRGKWAIRNFKE
ncbi:MAG: DUF4935 domain-containing protein [Bacilli bacterium]|nr:DUF4935 domain-containing protein [Bacilli bacterium]